MPNLLALILRGKGLTNGEIDFIPFELFRSWSYPKLRHLSLSGMTISKPQLLWVLREHPLLEYFKIETLKLNSDWASALDSMQRFVPRPQYVFSGIFNDGSSWSRDSEELRNEIQDYLNFGGVNPLQLNRRDLHEKFFICSR